MDAHQDARAVARGLAVPPAAKLNPTKDKAKFASVGQVGVHETEQVACAETTAVRKRLNSAVAVLRIRAAVTQALLSAPVYGEETNRFTAVTTSAKCSAGPD